jgi:hypothetical protein
MVIGHQNDDANIVAAHSLPGVRAHALRFASSSPAPGEAFATALPEDQKVALREYLKKF